METIYVLEAVSHAASTVTETIEQAKEIRDLAVHLAACRAYLKAILDSLQRPTYQLIVRIFSYPAQRLDEIQAIYTGVEV
jgi:hypothetical protein